VRLDTRRTGEAIAAAAGHLARIWRQARAEAWPAVFPGVLDGVVEPFLARVGEALATGQDPAAVWQGLVGIARLDRAQDGRAEEAMHGEWRLLGEVLAAAAEALGADAESADLAARAVEEGRRGTAALREGPRPAGVLVVRLLSGLRPRAVGPR